MNRGTPEQKMRGVPWGTRLPIRVLVADDHEAVLERVRSLLSSEFSVVATASDGFELLSAFARYRPDVVVADIAMPGLSGIDASRKLLNSRPGIPIVILSMHREQEAVQRAFDAGVMAYVHKLSAGEDLIPAIHCALDGKHFVSDTCKYQPR
jgi:DNA-binding NarL/FixJ family response regulator